MIDQFSELIKLSNECCNFSELTTSTTEVNALKEGVVKFNSPKITLENNQVKILAKDSINPLANYIIDQTTGSLSIFARDLIESTNSINPDLLFLFEYFSRFDNSNPPKNFNEILSEKLDPLSYFLFAQELFDSFSTIPLDMDKEQDSLSDIIKHVLLHAKSLSLTENISKLNIEILKVAKQIEGTNLNMFKPIFQECFVRSVIHNNRISKESMGNAFKCFFDISGAKKSLISHFISEDKNENPTLHLLTRLINYEYYLKQDPNNYPYGQKQGETIKEAKAKTNVIIEKVGNIFSNGTLTNGCYILKLAVNWEKKFKGTRLSNASFIEITYKNSKQIIEINNDSTAAAATTTTTNSSENDKKKGKRKSSDATPINIENSFIDILLPAFTKADDKVDISLVYVKEKFGDMERGKVPHEGFGTLASFTFPLNQVHKLQAKPKSKSKTKKPDGQDENLASNVDFELNVIHNDDEEQPFVVEFKRKEKALSTKCGSILLKTKYYDLQDDNVPELLQNNEYLTKSGNSNGYLDNLQIRHFLDFFIANLVNEWIIGKPYRMSTTGSTSILMSIFPPQEYYIGLIEFSTRYSIPASTVFLQISKNLLNAWCHAECYLNAFTAAFLSAHVCLMNNLKRNESQFLNEEEEELYQYIIEFLEKNVPVFMIQHLSKPALYQKHALLPLFMLLSFVIPEEKIDSYVDQLIKTSHANIIRSVTGYLKPSKLEDDQKTAKIIPEVENLMKYVNTNSNNSSSNDISTIVDEKNDDKLNELDLSEVTFSIDALSETVDMLNKRVKQLSKFYEDSSLPNFINQWESIRGELCQFTLSLVKMFISIKNRNDCVDQSVFKFIFSYREIYPFFSEENQIDEEEEEKKEINIESSDTDVENENEKEKEKEKIVAVSKKKNLETISEDYSPFKLFFDVILDWISRIGEQMIVWTTNAVKFDSFEIEDKKQKISSSPKDMMEVFRQSFNFIGSLHWEDPNIEIFIVTFLSLCGSCMRNYTDTLTIKMLSYFPIKVIRESKIQDILHYINDLESEKEEKLEITPRKIFVMINDLVNLRQMWNNFVLYVKKMFPTFFPENEGQQNESQLPLETNNSSFNSSSFFVSSPTITLPPQVMDPIPNLTGVTNSIPTLFSRLTSHLVTDTVSPHLWVKNSAVKQILVKKASQFILNPEFFKTGSPIYASIFDKILIYIKERIDDINATICMRYYKTMIISFLYGLDSGMMNLLLLRNDEPIKNKRLIPILNFIQGIYNEVFQYIQETAIENSFANDEKLESYTPHSDFMFKHVNDDAEQLISLVKKSYSNATIYNGNENDPDFLTVLCAFIIVSSQTNDKRQKVKDWIHEFKPRFVGKHFYPPTYK